MARELDAAGLAANNGTSPDTHETLVAEANTAATTTPPKTVTIELDAGNTTVHLPDGTDTSHPVQVGNDLEFIQPDGSIILIPNGAVTCLAIFVGNVEIPADAVAALFSANNIQPAEGPNGNNDQHAHGNFTHEPGGIGNSFGLTPLLGPTNLAFGGNDQNPRFPVVNGKPSVGLNATVQLDDDALKGGNPGGQGADPDSVNAKGKLSFDFGTD